MAGFAVPTHPGSSSEAVSRRMSSARRRDTAPEMLLRRELHRRGLRFRVVMKVPGNNRRTIDIAFTRRRLAVFVDGCFWHGCPDHGTAPRSNGEWWARKLAANAARDADTDRVLTEAGWGVLRIWEHVRVHDAADRVQAAISDADAHSSRESDALAPAAGLATGASAGGSDGASSAPSVASGRFSTAANSGT
ncbi:very short patch repair endonuclease [Cellulomonas sp. NPDC057328]|uniref:very short patch repair endonuclease n=1 Tax=Cellulomonas sp. NPDC057328 TaxID=3346101 RepID=UPI00363EA250